MIEVGRKSILRFFKKTDEHCESSKENIAWTVHLCEE